MVMCTENWITGIENCYFTVCSFYCKGHKGLLSKHFKKKRTDFDPKYCEQ